jgi:hypothetical protein
VKTREAIGEALVIAYWGCATDGIKELVTLALLKIGTVTLRASFIVIGE